MRFKIVRDVPRERVHDLIPKVSRAFLPSLPDDDSFTVIVFRDDMVLGSTAERALRKLGSTSQRIIVAGQEFTLDAIRFLAETNATKLGRSGSRSDEDHRRLTQGTDLEQHREALGQRRATRSQARK